jgi:nicotinamidase-related amidase
MREHEFWRESATGEIFAIELEDGVVTGICGPLDADELDDAFLPTFDYSSARAAWVEAHRDAFDFYRYPAGMADPERALVIVDMLRDFVDGALANPRAQRIVEPLRRLLAQARSEGWAVVFSNDAHQPGDPELAIWGEHAMAGTPGAQVISQLAPRGGEFVSPKRSYGAFDGTGLGERLHALGVEEVILAGQHTHICIRHSAYGALVRGFAIAVPRDAVCAFEGVDEAEALEYLETVYGARITTVDELVREQAAVASTP